MSLDEVVNCRSQSVHELVIFRESAFLAHSFKLAHKFAIHALLQVVNSCALSGIRLITASSAGLRLVIILAWTLGLLLECGIRSLLGQVGAECLHARQVVKSMVIRASALPYFFYLLIQVSCQVLRACLRLS
jgi:hypothetical protein